MNAHVQDSFEVEKGARVTPSPVQYDARAKHRGEFYELTELLREIEENFLVNTVFKRHFEAMWVALEKTQEVYFWVNKDKADPSTYKYSSHHLFAMACHTMGPVNLENNTVHFKSANGMIAANKGSFQFIPAVEQEQADPKSTTTPSKKKMTYEDAFNVLMLASFSAQSPRTLQLEGGNKEERELYYRAIKAFNKSVSSEMKFHLDPELEKSVERAASADKEMAAYMARVPRSKSGTHIDKNTSPDPTIVPDAKKDSDLDKNPKEIQADAAPSEAIPDELPPMTNKAAAAKLKKWNDFLATPKGQEAFKKSEVIGKSAPVTRSIHLLQDVFKGSDTAHVIKYKNELLVMYMENGKSAWKHDKFHMARNPSNKEQPGLNAVQSSTDKSLEVESAVKKETPNYSSLASKPALGSVTMDGKPLQQEAFKNLAGYGAFDPSLTLAKIFKGSQVDHVLPLTDNVQTFTLLEVFEGVNGVHGAKLQSLDGKETYTAHLDNLKFPPLPKVDRISGTVSSYSLRYDI